jgi:hypothetical protein
MARRFSFFEKVLLLVGIFIVVFGYFMIQRMVTVSGGLLTWGGVNAVFLWVLVILVLIILAANESTKWDLRWIQENQIKELKLIKQELRYLQKGKKKK